MTTYLGERPAVIPRLPPLDARRVSASMVAAANKWLQLARPHLHLSADTLAHGRKGLAPGEVLSDWDYAQLVAKTQVQDALFDNLEVLEEVHIVSQVEARLRSTEFDVRDGFGVMNTRFLRCGLFSSTAQERLPVLRSRTGDWVLRRGKPLTQDHLDLMMAILSCTSGKFDAKLGESIIFSPYQVCDALGMSRNHVALGKLKRWAADLMSTVVELHEPGGPNPERPTMSQFLGSLTTVPTEEVEALREMGALASSLESSKVLWQVVVPAVVYTEFVKKGMFSGLRLDVRRALNSPFQKWLASYMSTHEAGKVLAFNIPELAQAGGLGISTASDHGKKNQRRAVREAFEVLERGSVSVRKNRVKVTHADAAQEPGQTLELFEVHCGRAKGTYSSIESTREFKPLLKLIKPAGKQDPDTLYAVRL